MVEAIALLSGTIIAGIADLRTYRIPNKVTLTLLLTGLLFHAAITGNWALSLGGTIAALITSLPFYFTGNLGGGDVKLLAGIGSWTGVYPLTGIVFFALFYAITWALIRKVKVREAERKPLPFGFLLCLGVVSWLSVTQTIFLM